VKGPRGPGAVVLVALCFGVVASIRLLAVNEWDPTIFAAFGEEATLTLEYAEQQLGRDVITRRAQGHDGKFFFVQANDPWVTNPEENASILDRPVYRSQRMLYPVLAGGLGLFSANAVIWALVGVNIAFLALGSWAVARIAVIHGVTPWAGLAFVVNLGLLSELFIDGAGIVAFGLACLGAWALEEDRTLIASMLLAASALTREVMLVFVGFIALFWLIRKRSVPWLLGVPAVLSVVLWAVYIRLRIDLPATAPQVKEITLIPFSGMIEAMTSGRGDLIDYAVIVAFGLLLLIVPFRAWKSGVYLTWGTVGFAFTAPFLTVFVWQKSFDISRALAPLATAFVLELLLARRRKVRHSAAA
jgi:hypothetical protein